MQLFALFLTFISLFFVLLSFLPFIIIPSMALCFGVFFLLISLILGLISKCKFVWMSTLVMFVAYGMSAYMQIHRIQDYLASSCEELILEGNYQVSEYVIKYTNLAYFYPSSTGSARIAQLKHCSELVQNAEAAALTSGATPQQTREMIKEAFELAKKDGRGFILYDPAIEDTQDAKNEQDNKTKAADTEGKTNDTTAL